MSRERVLAWFAEALAAVDPRRLTGESVTSDGRDVTVIAIGKAAVAMCQGAADALGPVQGVCIADAPGPVPPGVELIVGDHPIPKEASVRAGRRALETARAARGRCIALVSGGGSALCEYPLEDVDPSFVATATQRLLASGARIEETNLVRRHLSAVKDGGLARAASVEIETLVLSDVSGSGPEVVASGPTLSRGRDPEAALEVLTRFGVTVPPGVETAVRAAEAHRVDGPVTVLADGKTAANAMAAAARREGFRATVAAEWLGGPVGECLDRFLTTSEVVTVGAGEVTVEVTASGRGGRNTHASLMTAARIVGTDAVFAALATDGVDGASGAAGAVVDGTTLARGGDPRPSLASFDSAGYLEKTGDLVVTGRTGTNVADLWLLWRT